MKTAILGWGSLIWDPRSLEIEKTLGKNGWLDDGPVLPIEFSRISCDGRLTLVIDSDGTDVRVLYAVSEFKDIDSAILNLVIREGCEKKKIGYYSKEGEIFSSNKTSYQSSIKDWINTKEDIDAVIWTNLSKCFEDKIGLSFSSENAVNYLTYQPDAVKIRAEQYIRRAPTIVDTPVRRAIVKKFGWSE